MTIRLTNPMRAIEVDPPRAPTTYHIVFVGNQAVALADTAEEAEQAKRAFELVLAPRFTRDEAIAIVLETMPEPVDQACDHHLRGIRLALVALADAGVFGDVPSPEQGPSQTMRDLLDAAGIK